MKVLIKSKSGLSHERQFGIVSYYVGHLLIYLGFLIISLVLVWLAFKAYRIYTNYQVMTHYLNRLEAFVVAGQTDPTILDMVQIEDDFRSMAHSLDSLEEELTPFLPITPYLGWVPIYGGNLQALPDLLAVSQDLSQTGMILIDALAPVFRPESGVGQGSFLPYAVTSLAESRTDFEQAEVRLRQHQVTLNKLETERLSPRIAHRVSQLRQYLPQVISGLQLAEKLPTFLGSESPRTYLILAQNSDELRPTGGYITAVGHIVFAQGQIVEFVMQDSYAVDRVSEAYPYPPGPIYKYMAADYWVLRDASWSPDFPTTARKAMELYQLGQGISVDGVIAFDQHLLPYLLRAFEPIGVDGDQVTSKNIIKLMRQHWAPEVGQDLDGEWWLQRKSFMVAVAETIRQEFEQHFDVVKLPILADVLRQALAEKHLLIFLDDPAWVDFLAERNWAGSLPPTQGDYLMVVDANLGFNKANAVVKQHLAYKVVLAEDGSAQANANLFYQHLSQKRTERCWQETRYDPIYEQNMARCYWDYVRLIVPSGAQLISGPRVVVKGQYLLRGRPTTGNIDVVPLSSDKVGWGQLFLLPPEESISLDYVYTLPPGTANFSDDHWDYKLYLQKQPGTLEPPAEVMITLPEGTQLFKSQPLPSDQQGTVLTYQVNLRTDQEIEISYSLP